MSYDPAKAWVSVSKVRNLNRTVGRNYLPLIKALGEVLRHGYWRKFIDEPTGQTHTFETFEAFLDWAQFPSDELVAVLRARGEDQLLAQVRAELGGELAENGTNQHSAGFSDTKPSTKPDATYILARLRRDEPEMAERVMAGEISANAAAIQAGFRKRYIRVPVGDASAAVKKLLTEYTRDELEQELGAVV